MSNEITVMTYNIWFADRDRYERLISLIENIEYYQPDVICFQEVLCPIYDQLKLRLNTYLYYYPENPKYKYNCVIFSKYPIIEEKYYEYTNTQMGRGLLISVIEVNNKKIAIATSHFESVFQKVNQIKIKQYNEAKYILENLVSSVDYIIFGSDTNITSDEEAFFIADDKEWKDAFKSAGSPKNQEYTYDSKENANLCGRKIGYFRSRIDRIVYFDKNIKLIDFKLIKGMEELIEPSDHFGVMCKFSLS
jgi:endonuclease/exonuclease/phosphatase family metal-dependent hydrolase